MRITQFIRVQTFRVCMLAGLAASAETVQVKIDAADSVSTSRLSLGVTHTHKSLDQSGSNTQAVLRAKGHLSALGVRQNTSLMGWGVGNPLPEPGKHDWKSLDSRIELMKTISGEPVITLCSAPGWMKRGGKDWEMDKRVLPEHYDAFAELAVEVAKRYPHVRHFIVWNEFKGFWSTENNNWDAPAYTEFYNRVYKALKAHDPDLKVGGFYLVIGGTGSEALGKTGTATHAPISSQNREVLQYWLKNKAGADFICIDRGGKDWHDKNNYTPEDMFSLTHHFGDIVSRVAETTELPIWYAEYYAGLPKNNDPQMQAAIYASVYRQMVMRGVSTAFLWNPVEGEVQHGLLTDVRAPDGGQPTPHYFVFKTIVEHFPAGTPLLNTSCTSTVVEVLASPQCVMLINTSPEPVQIGLEGAELRLNGYEVKTVIRDAGCSVAAVSELSADNTKKQKAK